MIFGPVDAPLPPVEFSQQRLDQMLGDIKRNSRNRRIAMVAPLVLAAAVVGAMIAAPPQHGGLALVSDADAESPDPQLPQVFGSNGVWRLAEPIGEGPTTESGPAAVVEAPTDPASPSFSLSAPDQEDLQSLPTSTSTPPTSTSGQSVDAAALDSATQSSETDDASSLSWSEFGAVIRIEPAIEEAAVAGDPPPPIETAKEPAATTDPVDIPDTGDTGDSIDPVAAGPVELPLVPAVSSPSDDLATNASDSSRSTPEDNRESDDVSVAVLPQTEHVDSAEANPSTPPADLTDTEVLPFSTPATIVQQSVLVHSAHVSVSVQVVDDDSDVIDWCNTRVDWGDGSVTRVAGVDDDALCTAVCEREAPSSTSSQRLSETLIFEHTYREVIDAAPRVFVATGDGCSYTLAELQLSPFTVVPLQ